MSLHTFITDLQNANPSRKLRWLIGLTTVSVAIIIGLWMLVTPNQTTLSGDLIKKEDQPTFLERISLSTQGIVNTLRVKTANTINFFQNKFSKTNTIEISTENALGTETQN